MVLIALGLMLIFDILFRTVALMISKQAACVCNGVTPIYAA